MVITKNEIWKPIPIFTRYEASNLGRIRSLQQQGWKGRILKPAIYRGYATVCLCENGKQYIRKVHNLVAESFIGPCPLSYDTHHKDRNKLNNTPENLEYLPSHKHISAGLYNPHSKLSVRELRELRNKYQDGCSIEYLSLKYGISKFITKNIIKNKSFTDINYIPPEQLRKNGVAQFSKSAKKLRRIFREIGLI